MKFAYIDYQGKQTWALKTETGYELLSVHPFERMEQSGITVSESDAVLRPPCMPSKIIAVGLNYRKHAEELEMDIPTAPVLFWKAPSAIIAAGDAIIYPEISQRVDYEAELAFVVNTRCHHISASEAKSAIGGYMNLNDVTARDIQKQDGQWLRAKSFDTFCPVGPWMVSPDEVGNPHALGVHARLNGAVKQNGSTADFIFDCYYLLAFISRIMPVEAGDVITTGTPSGIGPMQVGDTVEIEVDGLGVLRNSVAAP